MYHIELGNHLGEEEEDLKRELSIHLPYRLFLLLSMFSLFPFVVFPFSMN